MIQNLSAFDAAIRALAPINGVSADGVTIWFQASATPAQIAAATAAAASYVETPAIIAAAPPKLTIPTQVLPTAKPITML